LKQSLVILVPFRAMQIHDKDKAIFYCDNSKFADTTIHYTKHTRMLVKQMRKSVKCLIEITYE